jgi:hypothetical protein
MRQASRRMVAVVAVAAFATACVLVVGSGGFTIDTLAANGTLTPWAYLPFIARQPTPTPTPVACSTVPTLISPADGSNLDTLIPLFTVDAGNDPNATGLVLLLSLGPDAPTPPGGFNHIECTQGICQWRHLFNLHSAMTYYWQTYLMCGDTQGPRSEEWWFATGSGGTILPAPMLRSPANDSTLPGTTVTLKWSSVSGAAEYLVCAYYRDDRAGSVRFSTRGCRVVQGTKLTIHNLIENAGYSWAVTARNDYAWGTRSASWLFTTGSSGAQTLPDPSSHQLPDPQNHTFGQRGRQPLRY